MQHEPTAPGVPRPGDVIAGKYTVERVIGVGGMGVVVSALHTTLGQHFAIKFLLPGAIQGDAVTRFEREARAAAGLQSEHVVRTVDVGTLESGAPYMVMELLQGEDLGGRVRSRGPLPIEEAIDYVLQACEAIAEAHARGIVHRDLKPANLFLTRRADGSALVKVLDFGIAKATQGLDPITDRDLTNTATLIGSPFYMSPEQIRTPKLVDARSDVWALGVILFELISGKTPFTGENFGSLCASIVADAAPSLRSVRADVPAGLEEAVMRCLEKEATKRTRDVAILAKELAPFAPSQSKISIARIVNLIGTPTSEGSGTEGSGARKREDAEAEAQAVSSMAETLPAVSEKGGTGTSWSGTGSGGGLSRGKYAAIGGAAVVVALAVAALFTRGNGRAPTTTPSALASGSAFAPPAVSAPPAASASASSAASASAPAQSASSTTSAAAAPSGSVAAVASTSPRGIPASTPAKSPLASTPAAAIAKGRASHPAPIPTPSSSAPKGLPSASPLDDRK